MSISFFILSPKAILYDVDDFIFAGKVDFVIIITSSSLFLVMRCKINQSFHLLLREKDEKIVFLKKSVNMFFCREENVAFIMTILIFSNFLQGVKLRK